MAASPRPRALLLAVGGLAASAWLVHWLLRRRRDASEAGEERAPAPPDDERPLEEAAVLRSAEVAADGAGRADEAPPAASLSDPHEAQSDALSGAGDSLGADDLPYPRELDFGRPATALGGGRPSTAAGGGRRRAAAAESQRSSAAAWGFGELPSEGSTAPGDRRPSTAAAASAPQPERPRQGAAKDGAIAKGFFNKKPSRHSETAARPSAAPPPAAAAPQEPRAPREEEQGEVGEVRLQGLLSLREGRHGEAQAAFERMREVARNAGKGRSEGQACRLLARALEEGGAAEAQVEDAFKQALRIAHKQDDMELSFSVLTGMGSHALRTGDADLAEHFFLQAQTLAKRVLAEREEAIAEGNLAQCLALGESRRPEALAHFRKAVLLQERAGGSASPQAVRALHTDLQALCGGEGQQQQEARGLLPRAASLLQKAQERGDWEEDL